MKLEAENDPYFGNLNTSRKKYAQRVQTIFGWWGDDETVQVKTDEGWRDWHYAEEIFIDSEYRTKPDEPRSFYLLISYETELVFRTEDELHEYIDYNDIHQDDYEVIKVKEVTD